MNVSVIVPVYNQDAYLDVCLCSILAQTYHDFEVIVIDDGSTDESAAIAQKYPVYLIRQTNMGQQYRSASAARNIGIYEARGSLILPIDGDDWIEPTYLAKTVPLMTGIVGIVSTDMHRFGAMDDIVRAERRDLTEQLGSNQLPVTSLFRRKAAIEVGGYWPFGWEDWDLWLRLQECGAEIDVANEPLFHHRVTPNGLNDDQTAARPELLRRMRERHPRFRGV